MRDVLIVALMITAIALFAAYVALCDRIIGRSDQGAAARGARASDVPRPERERIA